MNSEQKKHLRERLREAERAKDERYENISDSDKPAPVRAAEKAVKHHAAIVSKWRNEIDRGRQRRYKAMMKVAAKTKETILFGDPEAALAALNAFEARSFK
jgi:hypothetical protein